MANKTYTNFNEIGLLTTAQNAEKITVSPNNVIDMFTRQKIDQTPVATAAPELNGMVSSQALASPMTKAPGYVGKTPTKTPEYGMPFNPFTTSPM